MILLKAGERREMLSIYLKKKYKNKEILVVKNKFKIKCDEDGLFLSNANLEKVKIGNADFVIFNCLVESKKPCKDKDYKKHNIVIFLNVITGSLYIFDLFKFNYKGFGRNKIVSIVKKKLIPEMNRVFSMDVSLELQDSLIKSQEAFLNVRNVLGELFSENDVYSIYTLSYIDSMINNKSFLTNKILGIVSRISSKKIISLKDDFISFVGDFYTRNETCLNNKMTNPETKRCIKKDGKKGHEILGVKECKSGDFYDIVSKRCIKRKNKYNLNLGIDIKLDKDISFKNFLGTDAGKTMALKYLSNKFPNSSFSQHKIKYGFKNGEWLIEYPEDLDRFIKNTKQFGIILVSLSSKPTEKQGRSYHLNSLIYNNISKEIEHFEPHGSELSDKYNPRYLYESLQSKFSSIGIRYFSPLEICPLYSKIQSYENSENIFIHNYGYCASWNVFYIDIRLSNPRVSRKNILKQAINLIYNNYGFKNFINNYEKFFRLEFKKEVGL